jgi:membrane associated rhomboid family serine protease
MTPWVTRFLAANVVVFFLQQTVGWLTNVLAFVPVYALVRPWTVITYMFLHGGLGHIFFNMLSLYFFGPQVEERLGQKRFFILYMLSGITGALVSAVFAPRHAIIGASGAVFGVSLAFAYYWPRARILVWGIIPVEAWLLVLITTVLALNSGVRGSRGGVADFAHLGGYLGAFIYLKLLDRRAGAASFRKKTVAKVADGALSNWKRVDIKSVHEVNREEVNRILDKISKSGIGSLTPQERTFLLSFVPPDDRPVS